MIKKLGAALGLKGILCIAALTVVALALVSYTTTLTITPIKQLTLGDLTDTWEIYVNDVDQVRYMLGDPGSPKGSVKPTLDSTNSSTYAFKVVTDANKVCAVKIELTAPANSTANFTKFEIRVLYWNDVPTPPEWQSISLYTAETGTTTKDFINGLISGDAGYIHQQTSLTRYYLIQVTYTYDDDATDPISVSFKYTPLPRDSFV